MKRRVLLIRHAQVALRWRGRCYGQTDVGLSREGQRQSRNLARTIMRHPAAGEITTILHSGLRRASYLAELIADAAGIEPRIDERWAERDFGTWETRSWNSIWRETGNAMDRMLSDPKNFRPGGGETTVELVERSVSAWRALRAEPFIVVVTHAGPIACVRCRLERSNLARLPELRIAEAATIEILRNA